MSNPVSTAGNHGDAHSGADDITMCIVMCIFLKQKKRMYKIKK